MTTKKVWVHSVRTDTPDNGECVIVKEKIVIPQEDGSFKYEDNLNYIKDPKRSYWMHQEKYRTYEFKREYVDENECDRIVVKNKDMRNELKKSLNIWTKRNHSLRYLCNSPYVYGADIDIQVLIKQNYMNRSKNILVPYTVGSLDSEVSVLGCDRMNILSFIHGRKVYCAILADFLYKNVDGKRVRADLTDVVETVQREIGDILFKYKFEVEYMIFKDEVPLIGWIWQQQFKHKTDFVGIWNLPYDMGVILQRLQYYRVDPTLVLCPPEVPKDYRHVSYYKDKKQVDHFTDSWDWVNISGYTQPVDSMRLYSRHRKVKGREPSYALDAIGKKEKDMGKQRLLGTHFEMQTNHFLEYIAYNIIDSILLILMEEQNSDISAMTQLVGNSLLSDFGKQTVMLKNAFYEYCRENGKVPATAGEQMTTPFDDLIPKVGGTVLPPYLTKNTGLHVIQQRPSVETRINTWIKDVDVGSAYPNGMAALNISKETKLATVVNVGDKPYAAIEPLFGGVASPIENCCILGPEHFNLPTCTEMLKLYREFNATEKQCKTC